MTHKERARRLVDKLFTDLEKPRYALPSTVRWEKWVKQQFEEVAQAARATTLAECADAQSRPVA